MDKNIQTKLEETSKKNYPIVRQEMVAMLSIEERAKVVLAQYTNQPTAIDLYSKDEVLEMLVEMATVQKTLDIETIPQLYIHWLMIDDEHGFEKPSWKEYAIKTMEE